jgi:hypothetical protein
MEDNNLIRNTSFTSEDLSLLNQNSIKSSYSPPNVNVESCKIEFFYEKFNQVINNFLIAFLRFCLNLNKIVCQVLSNVQKPERRMHNCEYLSDSRHATKTLVRSGHGRAQAAIRTTSFQCSRVHRFHARFD